jgi:integrase
MYRRYIEQDITPAIGHVRLGDLRPAHIEKLLRDLRVAGRGDTTRKRIHATIRSALTNARRSGLIRANPASDVSVGGGRPTKVRPWQPAELGMFLDHVAGHRLGGLFEVMAFAGLRRGEACALRWRDVDLDRGVIVVRSQLVEVGGKVSEGRPKTHSGEDRRVDIGDRVVRALLAHRLIQDAERTAWGLAYRDDNRVFAREDGSDLAPSTVTKLFVRLARETGLRPVRLHDLRHGAASLMLASGADLAVVSKRMGHSSIRVTADIYSHLLDGVGRRVADAAEALVPPVLQPAAITLRSRVRKSDSAGPP